MNRIELPALRAGDPLGFLAALGLLRALSGRCGIEAHLGWEGLSGPAQIHTPLADVDEMVSVLAEWIDSLDPEERPVDPDLPSFPLPRSSAIREPMRMSLIAAIQVASDFVNDDGVSGDRDAVIATAWFGSLVNQLAQGRPGNREREKDERDLSPFVAIRGQQTVAQVFGQTVQVVQRDAPARLREALTGWRRVDDFSGANFDARAVRDAGVLQSKKVPDAGVPGATLLAMQALPMCRLVGDGSRGQSTLWQRQRVEGRWGEWLVWPVWRTALDVGAVEVLIEHPSLRLRGLEIDKTKAQELTALDVTAVWAAPREKLGNADGPIGPPRLVWPSGASA